MFIHYVVSVEVLPSPFASILRRIEYFFVLFLVLQSGLVSLVEDDFDDNFDDDFEDRDDFDVSPLFKVLRNDLDFFVVNALLVLYISNHCPAIEPELYNFLQKESSIMFCINVY